MVDIEEIRVGLRDAFMLLPRPASPWTIARFPQLNPNVCKLTILSFDADQLVYHRTSSYVSRYATPSRQRHVAAADPKSPPVNLKSLCRSLSACLTLDISTTPEGYVPSRGVVQVTSAALETVWVL